MNFVNYIKRAEKSLHHDCTCEPALGGLGRVSNGVRRKMQRMRTPDISLEQHPVFSREARLDFLCFSECLYSHVPLLYAA
jgi:hypothetical protein